MKIKCAFLALGFIGLGHGAEPTFDLNVRGADVSKVFAMLGEKSGYEIRLASDVSGKITFVASNVNFIDALEEISHRNGFRYNIEGQTVTVGKLSADSGRAPASFGEAVSHPGNFGRVKVYPLRFARAKDLATKISTLFAGTKVVPDEINNSLAVAGAEGSSVDIERFIASVDKMAKQVLIEAQIIETSDNFSRSLGVSLGTDINAVGTTPVSAATSGSTLTSPNLGLAYQLGTINSQAIMAKLTAAETEGKAKVISRPRVVTADHTPAIIESGETYYVRVLGRDITPATSAGTSAVETSNVSGGLQEVKAGLTLQVTPSIMDAQMIELAVDLTNGEADQGSSVDGIPGVINTSAKTLITIKEGITATIAGLIKNQGSRTENRVPVFGQIPLLGWLFKSTSRSSVNNELMIFLTPHIVTATETMPAAQTALRATAEIPPL